MARALSNSPKCGLFQRYGLQPTERKKKNPGNYTIEVQKKFRLGPCQRACSSRPLNAVRERAQPKVAGEPSRSCHPCPCQPNDIRLLFWHIHHLILIDALYRPAAVATLSFDLRRSPATNSVDCHRRAALHCRSSLRPSAQVHLVWCASRCSSEGLHLLGSTPINMWSL